MTPAAIRFRSVAEAAAALAAAARIGLAEGPLLLSAPGAAAWPGAATVSAMLARAAALHPGVPYRAALDCGAAPGLALDALRQGWSILVLDPSHPAFPAVQAAAASAGATLLALAPPALDLSGIDLRRPGGQAILTRHLAGHAQAGNPPPHPAEPDPAHTDPTNPDPTESDLTEPPPAAAPPSGARAPLRPDGDTRPALV